MSNPYQSPAPFDPKQFQEVAGFDPATSHDFGWVSQVRIFAVLNGVQGILEIPMGLMTMGIGIVLPVLIHMDQGNNPDLPRGQQPPEQLFWIMSAMYILMGLPVLVAGVLRILAAWRNYRFRSRTLGMVSMIAGMASVLSCYCAPTALAVLIYGLILYSKPAVQMAFAMGEAGHSPDRILATFIPYRPASPFPPSNGA